MYNPNRLSGTIYSADKPGPAVPSSYPRVTFRIVGEKQLRVFDPRANAILAILPDLVKSCQMFIDLRCRAFVRLDGYNPANRSYIKAEVISKEVDHFACDHPLVNSQ